MNVPSKLVPIAWVAVRNMIETKIAIRADSKAVATVSSCINRKIVFIDNYQSATHTFLQNFEVKPTLEIR